MGFGYRLHQVRLSWVAGRGPLPANAWGEIRRVLSPEEEALFCRQPVRDQWHGFLVMQKLAQQGHTDPALLAAALLHDVGKTRVRLRLWHRVLPVLLASAWPALARRLGQGSSQGWRRAFVVYASHPAWGAEMAQACGSRARTVALIRQHQARPQAAGNQTDPLLQALQWADDQA